MLATLIGLIGDFDLAEEAAQEAFAIAADRWPRDGVPSNPRAWLITTARNRATDRIRRERVLAAKASLLAGGDPAEVPMNATTFPGERLEFIFTCCHPARAVEAQVAHRRPRALRPSGRHRLVARRGRHRLGALLGLDDFRYVRSTRVELLRRLGRTDEARDAYRRRERAHRRRSRKALP